MESKFFHQLPRGTNSKHEEQVVQNNLESVNQALGQHQKNITQIGEILGVYAQDIETINKASYERDLQLEVRMKNQEQEHKVDLKRATVFLLILDAIILVAAIGSLYLFT